MADASKHSSQVRRKQMILFGIGALIIVGFSVFASVMMTPNKSKQVAVQQPKSRTILFGTEGTEKDSWMAQSSGKLADMERRLTRAEGESKARDSTEKAREQELLSLRAELSNLKEGKDKPGGPVVPPPTNSGGTPPPAGVFTQQGLGASPPPPPTMDGTTPSSPAAMEPAGARITSIGLMDGETPGADAPAGPAQRAGASIVNSARQFGQDTSTARGSTPGGSGPGSDGKERFSDDDPLAYNRAGGRSAKTYLPAGTFVRAVVLNGLDAPTGGQSQQNPGPVLLRLVDNAQLPNAFKAALKDCVITANGTGDLSSERALIRTDRLSCIDDSGGAIDVSLRGYVSGEDGKAGMRGRLVTKSGQVIANALFTGVLSGFGEGLKQSASSTNTSTMTGVQTQDVKNPWAFGAGTGLSKSMDRIVQYYMKLADKLFPVVEIDAGRTVDVVITRGVTIERAANDSQLRGANNS